MSTNPGEISTPPVTPSRGFAFGFIVIFWIGCALLSTFQYSPTQPLDADAPATRFSAGRAERILQDLVGDNIPHPVGSEQNRVVRQRILTWLESFGYEPEVHATSAKGGRGRDRGEFPIFNIIARLEGKSDGPPVMLAAHYDSHPAGPGASDDGVGTAALLEIARMLKNEDPPARDIIFLITDGEEYGLLGAERFMKEKDWALDIHSVVNLEARGTKGPSLMFETGSESLWAVQAYSRTTHKPFTSSLFYEIYQRMPNDTDFSVFKRHGLQGLNFAYIGDVKHYHTPQDNLQNTDRGSLQHHGDNALELIRYMANVNLEALPKGRAVYFDLYGWRVIWWPAGATIWVAGFAFILCLLTIWKMQHEARRPWLGWLGSIATVVLLWVVSAAVLYGVSFCLQLDAVLESRFPPNPVWVALTYWAAALLITVGIAYWNPLRLRWHDAASGIFIAWSILGVVTAIVLTGGSYLFVVPALIMGIVGVPISYNTKFLEPLKQSQSLVIAPPVAVGLIWMQLDRFFYDAVGFGMFAVLAIRISLVATSLLPVLLWTQPRVRLRILCGLGVIFVVVVIGSTMLN